MNTREELIDIMDATMGWDCDGYGAAVLAKIEAAGCVVVPRNLEGHAIMSAAFYCNDGWDAICDTSPFAP